MENHWGVLAINFKVVVVVFKSASTVDESSQQSSSAMTQISQGPVMSALGVPWASALCPPSIRKIGAGKELLAPLPLPLSGWML